MLTGEVFMRHFNGEGDREALVGSSLWQKFFMLIRRQSFPFDVGQDQIFFCWGFKLGEINVID